MYSSPMSNTRMGKEPPAHIPFGHRPKCDERGLALLFHAALRDRDSTTLRELKAIVARLTPDGGATSDRGERNATSVLLRTRPVPKQ